MDAAREEGAVVDTVDDLTGGLGGMKLEGDGEAGPLDRPRPDASEAEAKKSRTPSVHSIVPGEGMKKKAKVDVDPEVVKLHGKKKAMKIAKGELVMEDGKAYDLSLVKALYMTCAVRWWKAVVMSGCGGGSS